MIDHIAARRLAATAIDGPLEPSETTELGEHLAACPACRNVSNALARDAAALAHLDLGPVPIAVRANVAIAAERGGRGSPVGRWIGLVGVGALLILALGSGALSGVGGRGPATPEGTAALTNPIQWQGEFVSVAASDFWIQMPSGRFTGTPAQPQVKVQADPGSWMFDVAWGENSANVGNVRLSLVGVDGARRVKGVRVSNLATGDWFDGQGPFVSASIGSGEIGDVDLDLVDGSRTPLTIVGHLHFSDLVLKLAPPPAIDPDLPVPAPPAIQPEDPIRTLRCSGLLERTPGEVAASLAGLGYVVTWMFVQTGPTGEIATSETSAAPDGVITSAPTIGADGVLHLTVAPPGDPAAKPAEVPTDCPAKNGSDTAPVPVATDAAG